MSDFKQDNLDFIISVGGWLTPCLLMLKRWSDEKATHEWGQLKYNEKDDTYSWLYFGYSEYIISDGEPARTPIVWRGIEDLIDQGWMVVA